MVEGTYQVSPSAIRRKGLCSILSERVLGNCLTAMTFFSAATGPRHHRTALMKRRHEA